MTAIPVPHPVPWTRGPLNGDPVSPAEDRRPGEARQGRRLVRERIGVLVAEPCTRQSEALQPPPYPRDHAAYVLVRGRRGRLEAQCAVRLAHEHAVEHQRVKMEVNIDRPAEALHARHHPVSPPARPLAPCLTAIG